MLTNVLNYYIISVSKFPHVNRISEEFKKQLGVRGKCQSCVQVKTGIYLQIFTVRGNTGESAR